MYISEWFGYLNESDLDILKEFDRRNISIQTFDIDFTIHCSVFSFINYCNTNNVICPFKKEWVNLYNEAEKKCDSYNRTSLSSFYIENNIKNLINKTKDSIKNDFLIGYLESMLQGMHFKLKKFPYREKILIENVKNIIDNTTDRTIIGVVGLSHLRRGFFIEKLKKKGYEISKIKIIYPHLNKKIHKALLGKPFKQMLETSNQIPKNKLFSFKNFPDLYFKYEFE